MKAADVESFGSANRFKARFKKPLVVEAGQIATLAFRVVKLDEAGRFYRGQRGVVEVRGDEQEGAVFTFEKSAHDSGGTDVSQGQFEGIVYQLT